MCINNSNELISEIKKVTEISPMIMSDFHKITIIRDCIKNSFDIIFEKEVEEKTFEGTICSKK